MTPRASASAVSDFGYDLALAARKWRRTLDEALARYGLSDASWRPLLHLDRLGDGARQNDLALSLGIEGPSLVRLLDKLVEAGLVTRREDATDRRAKTLHLTEAGVSAVTRVQKVVTASCAAMLEGVTAEELAICRSVFARIFDGAERAARP